MENNKFTLGSSHVFSSGGDITEIMDAARNLGITHFDTARHYKQSERVLGEYIRTHGSRDSYFIISKGCHPEPDDRLYPGVLRQEIETSLKTLDIGYIDLYFLHRDQIDADFAGLLKVLNEYVASGKIREYGLSNYTLPRIKIFNETAKKLGYPEAKAISNNYTLIPWENDPWGGGMGCVSWSDDKEAQRWAIETQIPLYSYSPLGRGFLSGRINPEDPSTFSILDEGSTKAYLSERNLARLDKLNRIAEILHISLPDLVLAYMGQSKMNLYPVVATTSPERLERNIMSLSMKLDENTIWEIEHIDD